MRPFIAAGQPLLQARRVLRGALAATIAALLCGALPVSGFAQPQAEPHGTALERERAKAIERGRPAKPTAPFAVLHTFEGEPALGQPVTVEVVVQAVSPATNVVVTFSVRGDLSLTDAPALTAASLEAGETLAGRVVVTPQAPGRSHLGVLVEGDSAGQRQARSVAIAVVVAGDEEEPENKGEAPLAAPSEARDGQAIRSLPAEERTR